MFFTEIPFGVQDAIALAIAVIAGLIIGRAMVRASENKQ